MGNTYVRGKQTKTYDHLLRLPLLAPVSHSIFIKSPVYHSTSSFNFIFTFLISDYSRLFINKYFCDSCDTRNVSIRIDSFWGDVARSRTNTGSLLFVTLCAVVLPLVSLHDSKADSERVFSMVKKTDIDCRSDLSQETICGLHATSFSLLNSCWRQQNLPYGIM